MKKTLFVMTHLGSNWQELVNFLKQDPRFDFFQTGHVYRHPEDLEALTSNIHRRENTSAVWGDVILQNQNFTCRDLCKHAAFVYWIKPFNPLHPEFNDIVDPGAYYAYRLTGIQQYYSRTPLAIVNPSLQDNTFLGAILG
jgi:hypothetical protein